jgi:hypothetical protein
MGYDYARRSSSLHFDFVRIVATGSDALACCLEAV